MLKGLAWGQSETPPLSFEQLEEITGKSRATIYGHLRVLDTRGALRWRSAGDATLIVSFIPLGDPEPLEELPESRNLDNSDESRNLDLPDEDFKESLNHPPLQESRNLGIQKTGQFVQKTGLEALEDGQSVQKTGLEALEDGQPVQKSGLEALEDGQSVQKSGLEALEDGQSVQKTGLATPEDGQSVQKTGLEAPTNRQAVQKTGQKIQKSGLETRQSKKAVQKTGQDEHTHPIDPEFGTVVSLWKSIRGAITAFDADELGLLMDEWREHAASMPAGHPNKSVSAQTALEAALRATALQANRPNLKYTRSVLRTYMTTGFTSEVPAAGATQSIAASAKQAPLVEEDPSQFAPMPESARKALANLFKKRPEEASHAASA